MQAKAANMPPQMNDDFVQLPRRTVIITMAGVMLAMFLAALDQTVVGTAMPRIIADLGGFDKYTWVTTAYLVASTAVVPIVGRLSDMYGRKWFYIAGIIIFLSGSVLCGVSNSMTQLIVARAVQGMGAGVMMANAFVAIGDLFPPAERGKYQGLISAVFGLSSVIGPTLGGFLTDSFSWHWVFFVNLPLGIPVIALFIKFFPDTKGAGRKHQLDYLGVVTLILMVVPLLLGLSWGGVSYPWKSTQVVGAISLSAVMAVAFIFVETRAKEPIIPLVLFKNRVFSVSMIMIVMTGFAMFGGIVFVPLFFQGVLGASATSSGSFLTPMSLGVVAGSAVSGQLLSRKGGHYKIQGTVGLIVMGLGAFLLSTLSTTSTYGQAITYIVVMGLGLGITFPVLTIAVQNAVERRFMGVATSSTQFFRSIGGTIGLAVLGSFMNNRFHAELAANIPDSVKQALPPAQLAQLTSSPQALVGGIDRLQAIFAPFGEQAATLQAQFVTAMKLSLANAVTSVFFVSMVIIAASVVVSLFQKQVPLAKSPGGHRPPPPPAE